MKSVVFMYAIMFSKLFTSSIGRKLLIAISGLGLVGFLIGHLIGNLLIFGGPDALNSYAVALQSYPALLWSARLGILVIFILHIFLGIQLSIENRRARPQKYRYTHTIQASLASRTMPITGLVMLSYVIYHLMHFTWGTVHGEYHHFQDEQGRHDVYRMVVLSFQNVWIATAYMIALFLTFLHLSHGLPSLLQSTGLNNPDFNKKVRRIAQASALLLFIGYASIPFAIYTGIINLNKT